MNTVEDYSLSALAKVLGRAKSGLHKLAKTGQIQALPNGRYDLASVQKALASNVDPGRRRSVHLAGKRLGEQPQGKQSGSEVNTPSLDPISTPEDAAAAVSLIRRILDDEGVKGGSVDFSAARTADLILKARERWLRLERDSGRLVDCKTAQKAMFSIGRNSRDRWMNWPSKISPMVGPELGVDAVRLAIVLEREVRRQLLESNSDGFNLNLKSEQQDDEETERRP